MPEPNAIVPERKKREYQKRGTKNDRVGAISERQAKLAAANHMKEIAKEALPATEPPPTEPPPTTPPSPVHTYNSFRKAHAGNKWTPKKMGVEWQAWKQAHPNK